MYWVHFKTDKLKAAPSPWELPSLQDKSHKWAFYSTSILSSFPHQREIFFYFTLQILLKETWEDPLQWKILHICLSSDQYIYFSVS